MTDGSGGGDSEDVLRSAVPAALDAVRDLSGGIYDDVIGFSNLLKEENVEVYRVKKNRRKEEDGGENSKKGEDSEDEHQLNRDDDDIQCSAAFFRCDTRRSIWSVSGLS